jgi:hypothetical protein
MRVIETSTLSESDDGARQAFDGAAVGTWSKHRDKVTEAARPLMTGG